MTNWNRKVNKPTAVTKLLNVYTKFHAIALRSIFKSTHRISYADRIGEIVKEIAEIRYPWQVEQPRHKTLLRPSIQENILLSNRWGYWFCPKLNRVLWR